MSQSRCKTLDDWSAKALRWAIDHPKESTKAQKLGSAAHKLALEPFDFGDEYYIAPEVNKRTKAGRAVLADLEEMNRGKAVIEAGDYHAVQGMARELLKHADARFYLANGRAEVSIVWDDPDTGVRCRARLDYLNPPHIIDVKTTRAKNAREFRRSIWEYGYDRQAAMLLDGSRAVGLEVDQVVFATVESEAPYDVAPYAADADVLACGGYRYHRALRAYAACVKTGTWPGKCPGTDLITMPDYALRDIGMKREFLL